MNSPDKQLKEAATYTVIDFETANEQPNSACALSYVRVTDGIITDQGYTLIRPLNFRLSEASRLQHGITENEIAAAPGFDLVWEIVEPLIANQIVVASNCSFDIEVLIATADDFGIPLPPFRFVCSGRHIQESLLEPDKASLTNAAAWFDLKFDCHNTLSGPMVAALIRANSLSSAHDYGFKYNAMALRAYNARKRA